jgi:transcription initiation factor IIE alpha subunit
MKTKEKERNLKRLNEGKQMLESVEIKDPLMLSIFFHEHKRKILDLLIEQELTLKDLRDILKLNSGSIKRFLDELRELGLSELARTEVSPYGIIMKYYRAIAKKFKIQIEFEIPNKKSEEKK